MDQNEKLDLVLEKLTELDNKMLYLFDKLEDTNQRIDAIYPNVGLYYKSIKKDLVTSDNNSLNNFQKLSDLMHESHNTLIENLTRVFRSINEEFDSIKDHLYSIDSSMMKRY
jgi:vacuolar-type H+-ATPase subunit D/Vma8